MGRAQSFGGLGWRRVGLEAPEPSAPHPCDMSAIRVHGVHASHKQRALPEICNHGIASTLVVGVRSMVMAGYRMHRKGAGSPYERITKNAHVDRPVGLGFCLYYYRAPSKQTQMVSLVI